MITTKNVATRNVVQVTFHVPVEQVPIDHVETLHLVACFNNWSESDLPMTLKDGVFSTTVELAAGETHQFRYLANDIVWCNDWHAHGYVFSGIDGFDNCVLNVPAAPAKKKAAPKKQAAPKAKKTKADDLKKIEGIGPKVAGLLTEAGIDTFAKLAKAKESKLQSILDAAGSRYRIINPSTWAEQSALAATGDWDALKTLQDALDGGKRK